MLNADWQNPLRSLDVNNDGMASPIDALLIINRLNDRNEDFTFSPRTNQLASYFDTNGDGLSSPMDVLLVINALNQRHTDPLYSIGRTEGESADAPADAVILEVGLGGTWDATNAADADVAVVCPIDLDHRHILGDTIAEIAAERPPGEDEDET